MDGAEQKKKKWNLKKILGIVVVLTAIIGGVIWFNNKNNMDSEGVDLEEFATKFLKLENRGKNMIYSPLSIKYALSILRDGASGKTKDEIETALNDDTLMTYQNVQDKLSLANALFIRNNSGNYVSEAFANIVKEKYSGEVIYDDFSGTRVLDDWIDEKTFGLIKNLNVEITENTEMIISNALAIQMDWLYDFNGETYSEDFYLADGSTIKASTMHYLRTFSDSVGYYDDKKVTIVTLGLERQADGTNLEFVAVMPKKQSLKEFAETESANGIIKRLDKVEYASNTENGLDLAIPKFGFDYELEFKNDLESMGIKQAFYPDSADFSRMTAGGQNRLYVSDAKHKANIEFSEEGIKAGAATAFSMDVKGAFSGNAPIEIKVDRPFMFIVYDKQTKEIWFVGTMYEPDKA